MRDAHKDYTDFGKMTLSGETKFKQVETFITLDHKNWQNMFKKLMNDPCQKIEATRIEQIEVFTKINSIKSIISILLELKQKNKLTIGFEELDEMNKAVQLDL